MDLEIDSGMTTPYNQSDLPSGVYDPSKVVISSYQLVGTGSESSHQVIQTNLKIVSLICNVFTTGMCLYLLYNLNVIMNDSKSNSQKRKLPLLKWSMIFIICFFINTILLVFVPFIPEAYPTCDFLMQIIILVTVMVFFTHWETNLSLFIKNRFLLMLQVKSAANRLTFMARVMNLASK